MLWSRVMFTSVVGDPMIWSRVTDLTPPHIYVCPKAVSAYFVVYLMLNKLGWEVIVGFIDIGESVDHHCINFLFMM
jgi:hypothetical protein